MSRFLRYVLMMEPSECDWLRSTHLKGIQTPPFESFLLEGNEDAPNRLALFRAQKPAYNDKAIMSFKLDPETGDLVEDIQVDAKHAARESVVFLEPTEKNSEEVPV